jgi:hypothetical protein
MAFGIGSILFLLFFLIKKELFNLMCFKCQKKREINFELKKKYFSVSVLEKFLQGTNDKLVVFYFFFAFLKNLKKKGWFYTRPIISQTLWEISCWSSGLSGNVAWRTLCTDFLLKRTSSARTRFPFVISKRLLHEN